MQLHCSHNVVHGRYNYTIIHLPNWCGSENESFGTVIFKVKFKCGMSYIGTQQEGSTKVKCIIIFIKQQTYIMKYM